MKTRVMLEIEWDENYSDHPRWWDWAMLLDLDDSESIQLIRHQDVKEKEKDK